MDELDGLETEETKKTPIKLYSLLVLHDRPMAGFAPGSVPKEAQNYAPDGAQWTRVESGWTVLVDIAHAAKAAKAAERGAAIIVGIRPKEIGAGEPRQVSCEA